MKLLQNKTQVKDFSWVVEGIQMLVAQAKCHVHFFKYAAQLSPKGQACLEDGLNAQIEHDGM